MKLSLLRIITAVALFPFGARAQSGNDNPTGIAGIFNGNVTTAGSYDPYTGNATRSITDLVVAGGLGAYPLAFVRTANSRFTPGLRSEFGEPGGWRHSYQWSIDDQFMITSGTSNPLPTSFTVNFPDGRREVFRASQSDSMMRASPGTRERFQRPAGSDNYCYLILPDGGKIWFQMDVDRVYPDANDPGGRTYSTFTFSFLGIIDPYQQVTTISYPADGSMTVTEPGGRWLKLFYGRSTIGQNEAVLWRVTASDGRRVEYSYIEYTTPGGFKYTTLWLAFYFLDAQGSTTEWATYEYQNDNVDPDGRPLLKSCVDPVFPGPMWQIAYEFQTNGVYGQIRSERYFSTSGVGPAVSTLTIDGNSNTRTETRGDGPSRTFTYTGAILDSSTDFKNVSASQIHDAAGFIQSVTDRRNNTIDFVVSPLTGNMTQTLFPLTPPDPQRAGILVTYGNAGCPDPNNRDANNPYYPCTITNERGYITKYFRDTVKRITRVEYPDGGVETFVYNDHGQVTNHGMTSGGTEVFEYDNSNGRLLAHRDPYHLSGVPTTRFQYDVRGRVSGVTDPRGAYLGDPNYTTNYEYDFRGQVTKATNPIEPGTSSRYYVVNQYNVNGTLKLNIDELGHATEFTYDDYKRRVSSMAPIAYAGDNTPRTTFIEYSRNADGSYAYDHTDSNVGRMTSPGGKITRTLYDENCRKRLFITGSGTETAPTTYTYDAAGNLETVKDPLGQSSGLYAQYFYDARNRLTDANDQIGADRNNRNHTVSWTYDPASNKTSELRANNQLITYDEYDPMNRLKQQSIQRDAGVTDITRMDYDHTGNMHTFQDGRGNLYYYGYDYLNRRTSLVYPDLTSEWLHYDYANNMDTFTNRAGAVQTYEHDNRNRRTHQFWDTWPLYTIHEQWMTYDPIGNIRRVRTEGEDIVDFVYDFRNRKTSESQTPSGRLSRTVSYTYDADSNRRTMTYHSGYVLTYDYTTRNQPWHQYDNQGALATYEYDLNGNRTRRTLRNGTLTNYTPDALNRLQAVAHMRGSTSLGRFDYHYDVLSRVKSVKRDFDRGDYYQYYLDDQLKSAHYDAYNVDLDSPWGAANMTSLIYDPAGNRVSQSNNSTPSYGYSVNNLNQYTAVDVSSIQYDAAGNLKEFDGRGFGYNRNNQLTGASLNGATVLSFYYDGLGRQILRGDNTQWTYSAWDGWDLLEEYDINGNVIHTYVHGAATDELLARFDPGPAVNRIWYYHDAQGSTTGLADDNGTMVERYKYPPAQAGAPSIFDGGGNPLATSAYDNRFLYTGREYYRQVGFYDYRNRTYLPSLGRFLQPDPIGFGGDPANLYRYCGNDPVNGSDPSGENGTITPFGNGSFGFGLGIYFHNGSMNTINNFVNYANERLTNTFGSYHVTMNLTIESGLAAAVWSQNDFSFKPGGGGAVWGYANNMAGASHGFSDANGGQGLTGEDLFLHEVLHLLGAKDHYTGTGANRVPDPGWEDNIMGGGGGNEIDARNIEEIVNANGWGWAAGLRGFDYVGYSLTDAISNTLDALNNYALAHGPGIGAILVRNTNGGSRVMFFYLNGGYTSGFTACPGGLCGAALDAWTQTMIGIPGGGPQPGEGTHPVSWELR